MPVGIFRRASTLLSMRVECSFLHLMRSKIMCVVAFCFLTSSPVQAGSLCPYHWWLALVALSEATIALYPQYRKEIRIAQILAVLGVTAYAVKKGSDKMNSSEEKEAQ